MNDVTSDFGITNRPGNRTELCRFLCLGTGDGTGDLDALCAGLSAEELVLPFRHDNPLHPVGGQRLEGPAGLALPR